MKIRFFVTAGDIKKGIAEDCKHCPVALAMQRRLKIANVTVGTHTAASPKYSLIDLPPKVCRFIRAFDLKQYVANQAPVKPFSFTLEVKRG